MLITGEVIYASVHSIMMESELGRGSTCSGGAGRSRHRNDDFGRFRRSRGLTSAYPRDGDRGRHRAGAAVVVLAFPELESSKSTSSRGRSRFRTFQDCCRSARRRSRSRRSSSSASSQTCCCGRPRHRAPATVRHRQSSRRAARPARRSAAPSRSWSVRPRARRPPGDTTPLLDGDEISARRSGRVPGAGRSTSRPVTGSRWRRRPHWSCACMRGYRLPEPTRLADRSPASVTTRHLKRRNATDYIRVHDGDANRTVRSPDGPRVSPRASARQPRVRRQLSARPPA